MGVPVTSTTTPSLSLSSIPKVTSILQLILRQFWDYPNVPNDSDDNSDDSSSSGTWLPMGYRQLLQEQSSSTSNAVWGRPFGICGIVLQWHTTQQQYVITDEFDPTGIVTPDDDDDDCFNKVENQHPKSRMFGSTTRIDT